jgi:hypothetical protein
MPVKGRIKRAAARYGAHRYRMLFYALLVTLAAGPLLSVFRFDREFLQVFLAFALLVAVLDMPEPRWRLALGVLAAFVIGLRLAPPSAVGPEVATGALVAGSILALPGMWSAMRFVMRATVISSEQVYAALSAYLLAGLFFGVLYWTLELTWPGSLGEAGAGRAATEFRLSTAIYFSFVTLATLGYGDVVPKSELARGLAVFEAVGGQLFIAVTIAGLVGARRRAPPPSG